MTFSMNKFRLSEYFTDLVSQIDLHTEQQHLLLLSLLQEEHFAITTRLQLDSHRQTMIEHARACEAQNMHLLEMSTIAHHIDESRLFPVKFCFLLRVGDGHRHLKLVLLDKYTNAQEIEWFQTLLKFMPTTSPMSNEQQYSHEPTFRDYELLFDYTQQNVDSYSMQISSSDYSSILFDLTKPVLDVTRHEIFEFKHIQLTNLTFRSMKASVRSLFFVGLRKLTISIENISSETFEHLGQLEELELCIGSLNYLRAGQFRHLTNLKSLRLAYITRAVGGGATGDLFLSRLGMNANSLTFMDIFEQRIDSDLFTGLTRLQTLGVTSFNKFTRLNTHMFSHVPCLNSINLSHNRIEDVDEECFTGLELVENLNLSMNNLCTMPDLNKLKSLTNLNLSFNEIKFIERECFSDLVNLRELDLSGNKITSVYDDTFQSQSHLISLNLSNNLIQSWAPNTFTGLKNLQVLNLSANPFDSIQAGLFRGLAKCKQLDLECLNLKSVNERAFGDLATRNECSVSFRNSIILSNLNLIETFVIVSK